MVEIKKQVVESSSKKPFRSFKRNHTSNPQPPNRISNVESDLDADDEETTLSNDETEDEELVEVNGMWYFSLPPSDYEDDQEDLPISTSTLRKRSINRNEWRNEAVCGAEFDKTSLVDVCDSDFLVFF